MAMTSFFQIKCEIVLQKSYRIILSLSFASVIGKAIYRAFKKKKKKNAERGGEKSCVCEHMLPPFSIVTNTTGQISLGD